MLSDKVLADAAFGLYCCEYADEFERHGGSFGAGAEITGCVKRPDDAKLVELIKPYVEKLSKAWKRPVHEVFALMGLSDDEYDLHQALYLALMQCRGHGIGLRDDYEIALERFEDATGSSLDTSPFHTELTSISEFAWENLEKPNPEYGVFEGDRLIEGKFWTVEAAEEHITRCFSGDKKTYEVFEIED